MSNCNAKIITRWEPRVVRHRNGLNSLYAIHDVYFAEDETVVCYTVDSLSGREATVAELRMSLERLLDLGEPMIIGDLGYQYDKEDVDEWLASTHKSVVESF